jgi:hypothetical protein
MTPTEKESTMTTNPTARGHDADQATLAPAATIEKMAQAAHDVAAPHCVFEWETCHLAEDYRVEARAALAAVRDALVAEALAARAALLDEYERTVEQRAIYSTERTLHDRLRALLPHLCIHCGRNRESHSDDREACTKAGYWGNRYESSAPVQVLQGDDRPPCDWCEWTALGTALHTDGARHPSCGTAGHGLDSTFTASEDDRG